MLEYIKRVSIAISFIAHKIDDDGQKVRGILEDLSFDLLLIAQNFRGEEYKLPDLKKLEGKVAYLIDVVDYARINNYISHMNATVFVEAQLSFLKHIINLIDQKNSLSIPLYHLKELDETFARKNAKENLQGNATAKNFDKYSFTNLSHLAPQKEEVPEIKMEEKVIQENPTPTPQKKILEENFLTPIDPVHGSLESIEKEIQNRRDRILRALSNGGGSIKEISSKLADVNEKTIQRDLLELMRDRKVIMLGKKRWAKYYLK